VSKFERLEISPFPERGAYDKDPQTWRDKCLPKYAALLKALESTSVHPATNARIAELLLKKLKLALRPSTSEPTEETTFIVSEGFRAYMRMSKASGSLDNSIRPLLRAAAPRFSRLAGFLESLLAYETEYARLGRGDSQSSTGSESSQAEENPLVKSLVTNLHAPSHELRLVSLKILQTLDSAPDEHDLLANMVHTEQIPFDLQNSRNVGIYLRKLSQSYANISVGSWLQDAIPSFLFGILAVPLSPLWDDAVEALTRVAETKTGEQAVIDLALEWLEVASPAWAGPQKSLTNPSGLQTTDFECLNLQRIQSQARDIETAVAEASELMLRSFRDTQDTVPAHVKTARSRSLRVLTAIPTLAEKRSRTLVPYLLSWANDEGFSEGDDSDSQEEVPRQNRGSIADKKALVGVFSQFDNPKALYQSARVYDALLGLLANGDVEIQKLALKAVFAWKQDGVKPYKESLESLLDESKFKNELTALLQGGHAIQPEHRSELMPVLLRLLYGRAISKKGAASGRHGLHATRLSVIRNLSVEDLGNFLQISLGRLQNVGILDGSQLRESLFSRDIVPPRTQVGLLNMLESIIHELGTSVAPYVDTLLNAVLYCLVFACRNMQKDSTDEEEAGEEKSVASLLRVVRTTSLKCLCALFRNAVEFCWTAYQGIIVAEAISPTIEKLPVEATQGVSWAWKLLSTWSLLPKAALILAIDSRVLPRVIECVAVERAQDEVKILALSIVRNLVQLAQAAESETAGSIRSSLLDPNTDAILHSIDSVLRQGDISRPLLESCVETVVEMSPLIDKSGHIRSLVDISTYLLNQPPRRVSPKVKGSILLILERFIALEDLLSDSVLKEKVFATLGPLFSFFKDRENRQSLARVVGVYASQEPSIREVADLCADLNSYVEGKLDQPDYERRLAAFATVAKERDVPFTSQQWVPLLHNLVHYIRQDEEFGILSANAADGTCKFIGAAASALGQPDEAAFTELLGNVVLPAIYAGARDQSEIVRREVIRVLGFMVTTLNAWEPVADLAPLSSMQNEDEDRSFFINMLSPAVSKQIQAMQLLEGTNERLEISSKNISHFFIPLLEHFIFGREDGSDDHGLGAQATNAIASLVGSLEWQQYRAVLRRFLSFIDSRPELQKQVIRLLNKVIDALSTAAEQQPCADSMDVDQASTRVQRKRRLAETLPEKQKLCDEVLTNLLPPLLENLHDKDESTVSARVPVGVIIVKLLNTLPTEVRDLKLPGVLTDICHILRSKAWESREMARDTLTQVSRILGPSCFGFVLTELRGALTRGYQLHVLSYTVHSLLLSVIPEFKQGDLDYCLSSLVAVIMDDIFGATGQEKEAEEYTNKMKEVKSSKSQDSMELIAKNASISHLVDLVRPLQALLLEKLDVKTARKIDELLNRITNGLLQNPAAESRDVLVFCYEVIQDTYRADEAKAEPHVERSLRKYLVKAAAPKNNRGAATKRTYKLVRFALDILRSILRKHDSLRNAANITGFLPILGDSVVDGEEEVKIAAFKLLTVLVKVPFKTDESNDLYKVAQKEAVRAIAASPSTASDLAQSALKLISVILRDRREVTVKDAAIDMLLGKLKDDLTEPLYRHVTFNFVRAVLDRRVETAAVYDALDHVGGVMITNDDADTRGLARGAYFQFLREYPQKKARWKKTLEFIVANLQYEREGGRISVMEVVHLLLLKSADEFVQEVASTCFLPLVIVLANDESERCRAAAAELVKEMFRRANQDNVTNFVALMRAWVGAGGTKPAITKVSLRVFGFYFEVADPDETRGINKDLGLVMAKAEALLEDPEEDTELANTALVTVRVVLTRFPKLVLGPASKRLWGKIQRCLFVSDAAVRLTALRLTGAYLANIISNSSADRQVLKGSFGLELARDDIERLLKGCLRILGTVEVDELLAEEASRILTVLGGQLRQAEVGDGGSGDNGSSDGTDDGDDEGDESDAAAQELDLAYLLRRLAAIVRKEAPPRASALVGKLAALDVLEHFCRQLPNKEAVAASAPAILRPLRNLTDPTIPAPYVMDELFKTRHEAVKTKAQAILDVLQKKLGTAEYSRLLLEVGEGIKGKRLQRSSKRKIEAITAPEKFGRDKRKKMEKKKEKRKARGLEHRSARRGY